MRLLWSVGGGSQDEGFLGSLTRRRKRYNPSSRSSFPRRCEQKGPGLEPPGSFCLDGDGRIFLSLGYSGRGRKASLGLLARLRCKSGIVVGNVIESVVQGQDMLPRAVEALQPVL